MMYRQHIHQPYSKYEPVLPRDQKLKAEDYKNYMFDLDLEMEKLGGGRVSK